MALTDKIDIDLYFTFHPTSPVEKEKFDEIRALAKELANKIIEYGIDHNNIDADTAIYHLRCCIHFAIASMVIPPRRE